MPLLSGFALLGFVLMGIGAYSVVRVRRDHAAHRAALSSMLIVEGRVARYAYSSISQDSGADIDNYRPIVKYMVDDQAYEIPMPSGDRFTPGDLGLVVPVACDPANPGDARFLEPQGRYAVYTSVAMALAGLTLVVSEWLGWRLFG